jgi:hypothetical protein
VGPTVLGDPTPPLFEGRRGVFLVIIKTRGPYWGAFGAMNLANLPQYDRFMRMRDEKGELLEML